MPLILGIGSLASNVIGGIAGNAASSDDKAKALELQKQALQNIMSTSNPTAQQLQYLLSQYAAPKTVDPTQQQVVTAQNSELQNIQVDPRLRAAQLQALDTMQKLGAGGMRPEDLAALAQVRNSTEQQANADRQSIIQNMAQRGISGSGAELAAQLGASQAAANRANTSGLDIAGQASQRALQAIANSGTMGSAMEGQQFGEAAQQAQAQDVINRYNAMNAQQVQGANVGATNQAEYYNTGNQNQIAQANVGLSNQQGAINAQAQQQAYADALNKAQAAAGATGQTANALNQNAAQTQSLYSGLGSAVGQGLSALGASDLLKKKQTDGSNPPPPPISTL